MANEAKPGSVHARLQEAISDVNSLNSQLENVIADPSRHSSSNIKRGKVSAAPVPWYSQAAFLIMDLHAWSRDYEATLRLAVQLPARDRGGSSANTGKALESIIAAAWKADDQRVKDCCMWLERWCRRARMALGDADHPQMLPQQPGKTQPKCPFCHHTTLRFWPLRNEIRCVDAGCKDDSGNRPRASMEISKLTGTFDLVWQDGISGLPV